MDKYIDVEKLIAELKRQKHELELSIQSQGDYGQSCHIIAYENILSLINSLQQEQPELNLEKEISRWMVEECGPSDFNPFADHWCADDIIATARHFYKLGVNAESND